MKRILCLVSVILFIALGAWADIYDDMSAFRSNHPEWYGVTTAPVNEVRYQAEFDPVSAVYMVWDSLFAGFYAEIVEGCVEGNAEVRILVHDSSEINMIKNDLTNQGISPTWFDGDSDDKILFFELGSLPFFDFAPYGGGTNSIDSIWTGDYCPFFVQNTSNTISVVNPRYFEYRINDDALASKLGGNSFLDVNVFRPDLNLEGGNLLTDGDGLCVTSNALLIENVFLSESQINQILQNYLGCDQVVYLNTLEGEGTGGVTMFFTFVTKTTVFLGEYDPLVDATNAARLDENETILSSVVNGDGNPLNIVRIPMPTNLDGVWRTYMQSVQVNDVVLVPVYSVDQDLQNEAIAAYQNVLPGSTIKPINSDDIIPSGGTIHAIIRTQPEGTIGKMEADPAYLCDGNYTCNTGCGDITYEGICQGNMAVWCQDGQLQSAECLSPSVCGWSVANQYYDCIDPGCGAVTAEGYCDGSDYAVYCDNDVIMADICSPPDDICYYDVGLGRYACGQCQDECSTGETGCLDAATRWSCGEAGDGDDCLEQVPETCAVDLVCESGACVPDGTCLDECTEGFGGCSADNSARWICGEAGDGDDCLDQIITDCDVGDICYFLSDYDRGLCAPEDLSQGCLDITELGECQDDVRLWCQLPENEIWFEVCSLSDFVCDWDGQQYGCIPETCQDECNAGETGCLDATTRWSCGEAGDGDDCLEQVLEGCPGGTECLSGSCITTCSDECAIGSSGCIDGVTAWSCGEANDGDDCLEQILESCGQGDICQSGNCVCQAECPIGSDGCLDEFTAWTCGEANDGDDCLEQILEPCAQGTVCQNSNCVCQDECSNGSGGCADEFTAWTCAEANDGDNCLEIILQPCGQGSVCENDSCTIVCQDECNAGETGCLGSEFWWTCGEAGDEDDCLELILDSCSQGTECQNGSCVLPCSDECSAGETGCLDATTRWSCGEAGDGDDCLEQVAAACNGGTECSNGSCITPCSDECNAGETGCLDATTRWSCGEAGDGDDCLDQVTAACVSGTECQNGSCLTPCTNECNAGTQGCVNASTRWSCGEADDGDDCLEQVSRVCGLNQTCQDGVCVNCPEEVCDGQDNDCDGETDEGLGASCTPDDGEPSGCSCQSDTSGPQAHFLPLLFFLLLIRRRD
jgi:agmatine/peptidylarginine deiminase